MRYAGKWILFSLVALLVFSCVTVVPRLISSLNAAEVLESDNFEKGTLMNWNGGRPVDPRWTIKKIDGNSVLDGKGGSISGGRDTWTDYKLKIKVQRVIGSFEVEFKSSDISRYTVTYDDVKGTLNIIRCKPRDLCDGFNSAKVDLNPNEWYTLTIAIQGALIKVSLNDKALFEYVDPAPLAKGGIQLSVNDNSEVYFDDLVIEKI